jgi:hypothetical protein
MACTSSYVDLLLHSLSLPDLADDIITARVNIFMNRLWFNIFLR